MFSGGRLSETPLRFYVIGGRLSETPLRRFYVIGWASQRDALTALQCSREGVSARRPYGASMFSGGRLSETPLRFYVIGGRPIGSPLQRFPRQLRLPPVDTGGPRGVDPARRNLPPMSMGTEGGRPRPAQPSPHVYGGPRGVDPARRNLPPMSMGGPRGVRKLSRPGSAGVRRRPSCSRRRPGSGARRQCPDRKRAGRRIDASIPALPRQSCRPAPRSRCRYCR